MYFITIDGGTTNTRLRLVSDEKVVDSIKINIGARSGIDDKSVLKNAVKESLEKLLERNSLSESDICAITAAGMITSEFGLYNLAHICTPAGVNELANGMKKVIIDEITNIPFYFIPGVKTVGNEVCENDVMRGEEAEYVGMSEYERIDDNSVLVLPGSHSKIMSFNSDGQITHFKTLMTGEMIYSLSQNTILKSAVNLDIDTIDENSLKNGYAYTSEHGINEGLFKVRILKNFMGADDESVYSFFMGVVLHDEISNIIDLDAENVYLAGKEQIKNAMVLLLKEFSDKNVVSVPADICENASSAGMIKILKTGGCR